MSEATFPQFPSYFERLPQYQVIEIEGEDAEKFLQGQLTCDLTKLAEGEQTLACHCDAKGKASAVFRILRESASRFVVIIRRELMPLALDNLKKYAVFSKVTFTASELAEVFCCNDEKLYENQRIFLPASPFRVKASEHYPERILVWGKFDNATLIAGENYWVWGLQEMLDGVPVLTAPNQLQHIPQALNLQCLEKAISFSKGCYIGQETVARAKYRGANKRALFVLHGEFSEECPDIEVGGAVEMQLGENWRETGTILFAQTFRTHLWVQVVMNKDVDTNSAFRLGNVPLSILPLPYEVA